MKKKCKKCKTKMQILGHGIRKTGMGVLSAHRTGWYVGRLPARTQVFFFLVFFPPHPRTLDCMHKLKTVLLGV